jgi:hypothetical protein
MTAIPDVGTPAPTPAPPALVGTSRDRRGSPIPTIGMIVTRIMELRKRRGLMIALTLVTVGFPTVFLLIRLLLHAFDPKSYGPAGGYNVYTGLVAGVLYVFGFIVAATLGCTAGSVDLTDGMFRHMVVTGRSRLALYLARIPAGLAIIVPMVAVGFAIVCAVCVFAAPTSINFDGVNVPPGLSLTGLENWAADHPNTVLCDFNFNGPGPGANVACGPNGGTVIVNGSPAPQGVGQATPAQLRAAAIQVAKQDYGSYKTQFRVPSDSLMIRTGLWVELEAVIGFMVGLGLASLLGQRTVAVVLMIVIEIILTPLFSRARIPHFINVQRSVVGVAMAHLTPGGLPVIGGGGGAPGGGQGNPGLVPESTTAVVCVIIAWLVFWTAIGAWRMMTRDA